MTPTMIIGQTKEVLVVRLLALSPVEEHMERRAQEHHIDRVFLMYVHICMYMCIYIYINLHIKCNNIYIYIYIYIYT